MVKKEFFEQAKAVAEERGISVEAFYEIFKKSLENSYKKMYGNTSCRVDIKPEKNSINVYSVRKVVSELTPYDELAELTKEEKEGLITEILLEDAKKIKASAKVGDVIEWQVDIKQFNRTAAQASKQMINQGVRTKQRELAYEYFKELENEMVTATVSNITEKTIKGEKGKPDKTELVYILDLGHCGTAVLNKKEIYENEHIEKGDKIQVYIKSVEQTTREPKITVTRTEKQLVIRLMEKYIPEIKEGIIEIKGIARDVGDRSKIAIYSNDPDVDPIGSCVGENGKRIKDVVNALGGEKIDLYKWSSDPIELITNSLQPATVTKVLSIDEKENSSVVIVPDEHLSLAIGKAGQNVRLAVQSCGWKIDIMPATEALEKGLLFDEN